jgi:DNA polymerase I-like protein with 3'-5' exonuclease and polymerase domains
VRLVTLDFETFYSQEYSLSKISTEEYIRHPDFEVIGVSLKIDDRPAQWFSGDMAGTQRWLQWMIPDWGDTAVLAHNMQFDGAILSWVFNIRPKLLLDTLSMARAVHGVEVGGSLAALAKRYGLGEKGTEVLEAKGKRRRDFTDAQLAEYGNYCKNDVELTYALLQVLAPVFPKSEIHLIDLTLRMFTEPTLQLNASLLREHQAKLADQKQKLLDSVGVDKSILMSNPQFADALRALGVTPPTKISLRTGKETLAFAKSDEGMQALQEHPNPLVQTLVAARLGTKSTLEETRTQRFLDISSRGKLPIPLRYYAAHTGRWGGSDSINLQNLPSRGPNAKTLKKAIIAPVGYTLIDADSSQIEARVLAWWSGQDDVVAAFAAKQDVYRKMGASIYNKPEAEITKDERFIAKATVLGCGYGMGAAKFGDTLRSQGVELDGEEVNRIVQVYRASNGRIVALWKQANDMLEAMCQDYPAALGKPGVVEVDHQNAAVRLPSGLYLRYDDLQWTQGERGYEYSYATRNGRTKIYGGKVVENLTQALARCIVGEQMLRVARKYRVVLTVHDSIVCCVKDEEVNEAAQYISECMQWTPKWASGLPVDCEVDVGKSYGEVEKWKK